MQDSWYWKWVERPRRMLDSIWNYKILRRDNATLIHKDVRKHRYELILSWHHWEPARLLGWTASDHDFYYVVQNIDGEVQLLTCVAGLVWLKDRLNTFEYEMMLENWERHPGLSIREALNKVKCGLI